MREEVINTKAQISVSYFETFNVAAFAGAGLVVGLIWGVLIVIGWLTILRWITAKLARNPPHSPQTDKTAPPGI